MSRSSILFLLVLALLIGGAIYLSRMDVEKPLTRVEKIVPNEKLGK
jgi:hypothetical protein